ncbi:MAG TPA: methyltransferase domain-containing protein [Candidatus Acidoferrales bacterium]|nr:methyltransferase domain-containing protein [Candidatus Acidoferrales bacterium]
MERIADLNDPRYLDEIGWFLYHERYRRAQFGGSYDAERRAYSRLLLSEVAAYLERDTGWFADKVVASVGCGCTGDLVSFPAAVKIAIDPLLHVYQRLGMLLDDEAGARTVYLSLRAEDLPLLDGCCDLVLCRNALDHMPDPRAALREMRRILRADGALFVSVDIGGEPAPDEPTVFSVESLCALVSEDFIVAKLVDRYPPHSEQRRCSVRLTARKRSEQSAALDKEAILEAYLARHNQLKPAADRA